MGSGMSEQRRDIWTLSTPESAQCCLPCNVSSIVNTRSVSNTYLLPMLLFTETGLTSMYCARKSKVSSHAQLPRNAESTYAKSGDNVNVEYYEDALATR